jgi:hypothetical protein
MLDAGRASASQGTAPRFRPTMIWPQCPVQLYQPVMLNEKSDRCSFIPIISTTSKRIFQAVLQPGCDHV